MSVGRVCSAAIASLVLAMSACGGSGGTSTQQERPAAAEGPVELTLEEELEAELDIPAQPDWMTSGYGSVWVSVDEAGTVDRVDPKTNEVVASIEVGEHPCDGIVAEFGSIWVPSCDEQAIYRISPETEKVTAVIEIPIFLSTTGALAHELAAGAGSLWIPTRGESDAFDQLARIDPGTDRVVATIPLGRSGAGVAATDEAVWVTSPDDGILIRVDPDSEEVVAEIDGLAAPNFVEAGDEGVWVLSGYNSERTGGDGSVSRIDPQTNSVAVSVRIDENAGQATDIELGEGFVWARTQYTLLAKIDPDAEQIVARYTDQKGTGGIVVDFGSVWLSDLAFNNVWRVPV